MSTEFKIEYTPKMSATAAHGLLTAAGAPFEVSDAEINGRSLRIWRNGPQTLHDVFRIAQRFGDREFAIWEDSRVSYGAFCKAVSRLAIGLLRRGLTKGDVVAIIAANSPEWIVAFFAITLAGGIAAPINPSIRSSELASTLALSSARIAFCDKDRVAKVCDAAANLPTNVEVISWHFEGSSHSGFWCLEDLVGPSDGWGQLSAEDFNLKPSQPHDDASIFFTSGTTGEPKGALSSHRANVYNVFHAAFRNARRFLMTGETPPETDPRKAPQQVCLVPHPLFHVSSLIATVIPIICRGGKIVLMRWWAAERALQLIERERVDLVGGVPTVACQILDHPHRDRYDMSSVQSIVYGGAPSPLHVPRQAAKAGLVAGQSWGMTETTGGLITTIGAEFLNRPGSCGLPSAVHDLEIRDEFGDALQAGQVGELWVRGPQIMTRYWRNPEASALSLRDGWLRTGDLARIDEDGYCYVVDRLKDMIICGGENIYCGEIEAVLESHPDILEAAALGIEHHSFGEQAVAVVVRRPDCPLTEQQVRSFAAKALPPNKVPTRIVLTDAPLCRNEAGKLRKQDLRQLFASRTNEALPNG